MQRQPSSECGQRQSAFTLMELLVTVSIIALLMAMLMPAIKIVRDSGRTLKCKANLRQIMLGMHGYAQDWNGKLVPHLLGDRWFVKIGQYLDGDRGKQFTFQIQGDLTKFNNVIWGCPIYNIDRARKGEYDYDWRPGYGLAKQPGLPAITAETNWSNWIPGSNVRDIRLAELTCPSRRLLSTETNDWYTESSLVAGKAVWSNPGSTFSRGDVLRHQGRANYGFLDGHVATLLPTNTAWAYQDPEKFTE